METKEILITEEGVKVHGFKGTEIVAVLVEALVHSWKKEVGTIDLEYAGKTVIDALADAERDYKIKFIYDVLTGDNEDGD